MSANHHTVFFQFEMQSRHQTQLGSFRPFLFDNPELLPAGCRAHQPQPLEH